MMAINKQKSDTGQTEKTLKIPLPKDDDGTAPKEIGGREGLDPTRFGDWEKNGRCIDF